MTIFARIANLSGFSALLAIWATIAETFSIASRIITLPLDCSAVARAISAILFGLSAWSIPAIMAAACGDALGPRLAPAALGFITLFFGIGQALGPAVAGAIAGVVREHKRAEVQAIGAGAVNQAVKALVLATGYLKNDGINVVCVPEFVDVEIEDKVRTAVKLVVEPR